MPNIETELQRAESLLPDEPMLALLVIRNSYVIRDDDLLSLAWCYWKEMHVTVADVQDIIDKVRRSL